MNKATKKPAGVIGKVQIERVQTGVRLEKRLVKVLKALAEYSDVSLGELIESIAIHSLEREHAFMPDAIPLIKKFKDAYEMSYDIHAYEKFKEGEAE
jgi:hypothetical protein